MPIPRNDYQEINTPLCVLTPFSLITSLLQYIIMMAVSIAKGICAAMAGGYIAKLAVNALAVSSTAATFAAVAFGSFTALLFYARVWIQGYYFDNRYTKRADLAGRVVIVTGGTVGGLGFAGAQLLCELGATIVLTVRSDAKKTSCPGMHWLAGEFIPGRCQV